MTDRTNPNATDIRDDPPGDITHRFFRRSVIRTHSKLDHDDPRVDYPPIDIDPEWDGVIP